ncbi:MAG: hypothetical protein JSS03_02685 [Proteobacteria bacterium]|nr:hypothetical protein [Pseudomonadota bacterium]
MPHCSSQHPMVSIPPQGRDAPACMSSSTATTTTTGDAGVRMRVFG